MNLERAKKEKSFQKKSDNKGVSEAHGGRGLRGRVLKKRKERQVINK